MKHIILLLFLALFITSACSAQAQPDEDQGPRNQGHPIIRNRLIPIEFSSTDTCNLTINGLDYGKILKNGQKTIKLRFGNYKFVFESLETGEIIRNRSFRFNRDSVSEGKYIYSITFKK